MHAYLIVGGSRETRRKKLEEFLSQNGIGGSAGERFNLGVGQKGDSSLKIEDVREAEGWVSRKRNRAAGLVVEEADRLTLPAQHAFLKTLEEPRSNILIVLTVADSLSLLPTVRSRCKIIRLPAPPAEFVGGEKFRKLLRGTMAEKLVGLYPILKEVTGSTASLHRGAVKRPEALMFIEAGIVTLRDVRRPCVRNDLDKKRTAVILNSAIAAHRRLKNNLNPTLTLNQFILDISPASG